MHFYKALEAKYTAEIEEAKATLHVYFNHPVGIGEHSDLMTEYDKWISKMETAQSKLQLLRENFEK